MPASSGQHSLDPVTVAAALFAAWLGPTLAQVIGAYFVIIVSAAAGSGWALMRKENNGTLKAIGFVTLMMVTSTLTTVGVAQIANHFLKLSESTENFLLPTIALVISGIGQDWVRVLPWFADTIVQLIMTMKGNGNGYNRSSRDYSSYNKRPGVRAADDERTGAIGDE